MPNKPNLLLMGHETSLGIVFAGMADSKYNIKRLMKDQYPYDQVSVIVNCIGRNHLARIGADLDVAAIDIDLLIDNVAPIYEAINSIIRLRHGPCRVLNIASQTYRIPQTNTALYCASKAALVQLTRTMARELAPAGWVINCLAPGKIEDTRMAKLTDAQVLELRGWTKDEADAYALRNIPMGRFTSCIEVSIAMLKILELPSYINGACIDMTGGA